MKRHLEKQRLIKIALVYFLSLAFLNCTPEKIKESTDETVNITQYIRDHEEYSLFLEALELTNYASFLNTYGTYTLFLPTNDAMNQYLKDAGVSSLKDIPLKDLQDLIKLHILDKTVVSTSFTDGKIATPSMHGQYLVTGASNINGRSRNTVNRTSNIIVLNLMVGNGVIHVIDRALRVADKTLAQTIEANPNLSLFTEVLKATGWYDKLNQPVTYDGNKVSSHTTVLAQTNQVYDNTKWTDPSTGNEITLNTLENLIKKYSTSANLTDPTNGLNLYVQYHVLLQLNYLADLAVTPVFETKVANEVVSSTLIKDVIYINRDTFNDVLEEGFTISREPSDLTCSNGVLHYVNGDLEIKKRLPMPVYFDPCDQPEFAANAAVYRKPGTVNSFGYPASGFTQITWEGALNAPYLVSWVRNEDAWKGDQLEVFRLRPTGNKMVTFTTPVIIKGRYKIWVTYRQNGSASNQVKTFFDGVELPKYINLKELANPITGSSYLTDAVLESQGYKRPMYPYKVNSIYSRMVGIVDVDITGKHKFTVHSDADGGQAWFDIIEFRPIDMDQIWPKFKAGLAGAGGLVQRADAPTDN